MTKLSITLSLMLRKTPLRKVGRIGIANREARQKIAIISEEKQLRQCEIQLPGCLKNWFLAPAHKHKRGWYAGCVDMLADYNEWVCACQSCHDQIENNPALTEEVFNRLRPTNI